MSEVRTATVLEATPGERFHTVYAEAELPLGALPGQWGAFHTDLSNPLRPGQTLRRAWSFAELEGERRFRLFVATVGPSTRWLAAQGAGVTLRFTGPWGSRFKLDDGQGPAAFFAAGSGISPLGAMVDACLARGRQVRLCWETAEPSMQARIDGWRAAGVEVDVGPRLAPTPTAATWWLAGDGPRLDEVNDVLGAPPERVERFYTPQPSAP